MSLWFGSGTSFRLLLLPNLQLLVVPVFIPLVWDYWCGLTLISVKTVLFENCFCKPCGWSVKFTGKEEIRIKARDKWGPSVMAVLVI